MNQILEREITETPERQINEIPDNEIKFLDDFALKRSFFQDFITFVFSFFRFVQQNS